MQKSKVAEEGEEGERRREEISPWLIKEKDEKENKVEMDWRCAGKDKEEEEEEEEGARGLYCGIYDLWL